MTQEMYQCPKCKEVYSNLVYCTTTGCNSHWNTYNKVEVEVKKVLGKVNPESQHWKKDKGDNK